MRRFVGADLHFGGTQLIHDYPHQSPNPSGMSGESTGSDGPLHEPTQLLYTQLLDQYEGRMDGGSHKGHHLDLDMETQLVDDHNFDIFGQREGLLIHSEDEASKETQLIQGDEAHSGSSSGKDGEVDSAFSSLNGSLRQKTPHWLSELTNRNRGVEGMIGRAARETFPASDRYLGGTQILSDDENGDGNVQVAGRSFSGAKARTELRRTDGDVPHFLRDFDPNKREYPRQRVVGNWHEIVGQSAGCNEDDRGWESTVRGLGLVDSDASTEDGTDNWKANAVDTGPSYPGRAHVARDINSRSPVHVANIFCSQDLNKLPEPENPMDEWGDGVAMDKDFARINESGPNADLFNRDQPTEIRFQDQCTRIEPGVIEDLNEITVKESTVRTAGSIRAASLRTAALRAPSYPTSGHYAGPEGEEAGVREGRTPLKIAGHAVPTGGDQSGIFEPPITGRETVYPSNVENRGTGEKTILHSFQRRSTEFSKVGQDNWSARSSSKGSKLGENDSKKGEETSPENRHASERKETSDYVGAASLQVHPQAKKFGMKSVTDTEHSKSKECPSPGENKLERRGSFGSGLFSGGGDMSYLNLQSPGEDSQARALNMVDKLVWLNGVDLPQYPQVEQVKTSARGPFTGKSILQSRAQVAEARAGMNDPLGVFDWVDSQNDGAGNVFGSGVKSGPAKGVSGMSDTLNQSKQSVSGQKRVAAQEAFGGRNKRLDKAFNAERDVQQNHSTSKQRALWPTNLSAVTERKKDDQTGRSVVASFGNEKLSTRSEAGPTVEESRPGREGRDSDMRPDFSDKGPKLGSVKNSVSGDGSRTVLPGSKGEEVKIPSDIEDKPGKQGLKSSSQISETLIGHKRKNDKTTQQQELESDRHSKRQPSVENLKCVSSNEWEAANMISEDTVQPMLQESNDQDKIEEGDCVRSMGTSNLPGPNKGNSSSSDIDGKVERRNACDNVIPDRGDILKQRATRTDVWHMGHSTGSYLEKHPRNCKSEPAVLQKGLDRPPRQQPNLGDTTENNSVSPESARRTVGYSKQDIGTSTGQSTDDRNGLNNSGCQSATGVASVDTRPDVQGEPNDTIVTAPNHIPHGSPDSKKGREFSDSHRHKHTDSPVKEDWDGNTAFVSEIDTRGGVEMDETTEDGEMFQVVKKGVLATRRGRTHTRSKPKLLQNSGRSGGTINPIDQKGKRRRVTWAGPLELVSRQNAGLRNRHTLGWRDRDRDDEANQSPSHSSGQDEEEEQEAVDVRDVKSECGLKKRTAEVLETMAPQNADLEKIKRRFNMSDAAVARLLGTDEEDTEPNHTMGVKVRSLSNIQPGLDENEAMASPVNFRRVSKGLRSVRNRIDDSSRKLRTYPGLDLGKVEKEEVMQSDETVVDGSIDGTSTIETHPSDNEVNTGRRRMRSIADVSSPYLPQTSGRPIVARGLRKRRSGNFMKPVPPPKASFSDDEVADTPPSPPPPSPGIGRLRGKGAPRSVRKRKERVPEYVKAVSEVKISPNTSKDSSGPSNVKRRRRSGLPSVLLSHGLTPDIIKKQGKIVTRLGGRIVHSASECTHFVADKFVRTGNMLEAMASGKPVVNVEWLERCSVTNRFADEEDFILDDQKKEDEMGFSMTSTLAAARERGLLQGIRVYITPGTSPGPDSLARIVRSAGGQVVDEYVGPAPNGEQDSGFCIVISSQEELDDCIPLLEQGAKVYTPELILSGVTNYYLDISSDQLFKNFSTRRRRGSLARRTI